MKKKTRISMVLTAAALIVALLAGAGIAGTKLGVFHMLDTADPIVPLEGAEALVGTDLGTVENEMVTLTVEEAVFDGQGALVQLRIAPKDADRYVMYDDMLQDPSEELFETSVTQVEVPEGRQGFQWDGKEMEIVNENGNVQLLWDGESVEIPEGREAALAQGLPFYMQDGRAYYADLQETLVTAGRNGQEIIGYWPKILVSGESEDAEALGLENFFDTLDAEGQEDGSVIVWASGYAQEPLDISALEISCGATITLDGAEIPLDSLTLTLPKNEEERKVTLTPVDGGAGERFEILSGSITLTKVRAYLALDYSYEQAEDEDMGITFRMYDADGNRITLGGGSCTEEDGVFHELLEMQSFDEIPEMVWLEAKVIGEDKTLGRVECRLTEE